MDPAQQRRNFDRLVALEKSGYPSSSAKRQRYSELRKKRKLPSHMVKIETHDLLNDKINTSDLFNKLLNKENYNNIFNNLVIATNSKLEEFKATNKDMRYNYFIAGSRAWNRFFKDFYDLNILSPYEKSAIHNTNGDLHYIINNKAYVNVIKANIKELLEQSEDEILEAIRANMGDDAKSNEIAISISEKDFISGRGSLMTSKRLYINLHINEPDGKKRKAVATSKPATSKPATATPVAAKPASKRAAAAKAAEEEAKKAAEIAAKHAADREARASKRAKQGGGAIKSLTQVIFSIDFYYNENSTLAQDNLLVANISNLIEQQPNGPRFNYLNLYGLYIYLQIALKQIYCSRTAYNPFKIREIIFDKIILTDTYKIPALKEVVNKYYTTFNQTTLYNDEISIILKKIYALAHEPIAYVINEMEIAIIEHFRPYINETINNLNNNLISGIDENIGLFVVGGDALRRYKNDITQTIDIDCKVYIPKALLTPTNKERVKNRVNNAIVEELTKLLCYLSYNRDKLFTEIEPKEYETPEYKITYTLINEAKNFRFRQHYKTNKSNNINIQFPVDLYSLDYEYNIEIEIKDDPINPSNNTKISYKYNIAFLDIVIEESETSYKANAVLSNGIPISSLEFLLKDLKNTYNSDTSSFQRFISGKITKDYNRYNELLKIIEANNFKLSTEPLKKIINVPHVLTTTAELHKDLYYYSYEPETNIKLPDKPKSKSKSSHGSQSESEIEIEIPVELKLPVLFETNDDRKHTLLYQRRQLDLMNDYNKYYKKEIEIENPDKESKIKKLLVPNPDFIPELKRLNHRYQTYYSKLKETYYKKMCPYDIDFIIKTAIKYEEEEEEEERKIALRRASQKIGGELDQIEDQNKEQIEEQIEDQIEDFNYIIYNTNDDTKDDKIDDKIDKYIIDIMSPHDTTTTLSEEKISNFYKKLTGIIKP